MSKFISIISTNYDVITWGYPQSTMKNESTFKSKTNGGL